MSDYTYDLCGYRTIYRAPLAKILFNGAFIELYERKSSSRWDREWAEKESVFVMLPPGLGTKHMRKMINNLIAGDVDAVRKEAERLFALCHKSPEMIMGG